MYLFWLWVCLYGVVVWFVGVLVLVVWCGGVCCVYGVSVGCGVVWVVWLVGLGLCLLCVVVLYGLFGVG